MTEKILFVDDEENLLRALKRQFRKAYQVSVAASGKDALQILADDGPFAVIVSDMQMPEMNGIQFLQAAQKRSPDSVRIMLTGNADQKTAVDAVNNGNVFSFYTKPCSIEVMTGAIEKAVAQYRIQAAERQLLEETLNGSIKLLMELLSMMAPELFSKTLALQSMIDRLDAEGKFGKTWNLELAVMLSNVASLTLPPETLQKLAENRALDEQEHDMIAHLPETGKKLISNIPRLDDVADIVFYQNKHYDGSGFPDDARSGEAIPDESRLLKILIDLEDHKSKGYSAAQSVKLLAADKGKYDPVLLDRIDAMLSEDTGASKHVPVNSTLSGLQPGYILASNIETVDGKLLCSAGHKITSTLIERLLNYNHLTRIREPIQIYVDEAHRSAEAS